MTSPEFVLFYEEYKSVTYLLVSVFEMVALRLSFLSSLAAAAAAADEDDEEDTVEVRDPPTIRDSIVRSIDCKTHTRIFTF